MHIAYVCIVCALWPQEHDQEGDCQLTDLCSGQLRLLYRFLLFADGQSHATHEYLLRVYLCVGASLVFFVLKRHLTHSLFLLPPHTPPPYSPSSHLFPRSFSLVRVKYIFAYVVTSFKTIYYLQLFLIDWRQRTFLTDISQYRIRYSIKINPTIQ